LPDVGGRFETSLMRWPPIESVAWGRNFIETARLRRPARVPANGVTDAEGWVATGRNGSFPIADRHRQNARPRPGPRHLTSADSDTDPLRLKRRTLRSKGRPLLAGGVRGSGVGHSPAVGGEAALRSGARQRRQPGLDDG